MSVEAMAIAMHHSRASKASTRLVLVGIANHDGDGGAWPSVKRLGGYAAISDRAVQLALNELISLGEISRDIQRGGTADVAPADRPNLYHFLLTCPPHCDRTRSHKLICRACGKPLPLTVMHQTSVFHPDCDPVTEGVNPSSPGEPQFTGGVNPSSPKPSLEPFNHLEQSPYVPNREREAGSTDESEPPAGAVALPSAANAGRDPLEGLDPCPRHKFMPHAFNAGICVDCGALDPTQLVNFETGEVA